MFRASFLCRGDDGTRNTACMMMPTHLGRTQVISTILLNYIGVYLVDFMVSGPIKAGGHRDAPTSWPVLHSALYPKLIPHTQLHMGFIIAILAMILMYIIMRYTTLGHRVKIVGFNPKAARHAGIHTNKIFFTAFFVSGALAGLAGAAEILGYRVRLMSGFAPNTGYDAIAVALLGGYNPFMVGLSSLFFAALENGAVAMEAIAKLPAQLVDIVWVLAILAVLAASSPAIFQMIRRRQENESGRQQ